MMRRFLLITVRIAAIVFWAQLTSASARAGATGKLRLTFTERSPLSAVEVIVQRMDDEQYTRRRKADNAKSYEYDLANESFDVYVPPDYRSNVPHGLLIWR